MSELPKIVTDEEVKQLLLAHRAPIASAVINKVLASWVENPLGNRFFTAHALSYIDGLTLSNEILKKLEIVTIDGLGLKLLDPADNYWRMQKELCDDAEENLALGEKSGKILRIERVFEVKFEEFIAARALRPFMAVSGDGCIFLPGVWYRPRPRNWYTLKDIQIRAKQGNLSSPKEAGEISSLLLQHEWCINRSFIAARYERAVNIS